MNDNLPQAELIPGANEPDPTITPRKTAPHIAFINMTPAQRFHHAMSKGALIPDPREIFRQGCPAEMTNLYFETRTMCDRLVAMIGDATVDRP